MQRMKKTQQDNKKNKHDSWATKLIWIGVVLQVDPARMRFWEMPSTVVSDTVSWPNLQAFASLLPVIHPGTHTPA